MLRISDDFFGSTFRNLDKNAVAVYLVLLQHALPEEDVAALEGRDVCLRSTEDISKVSGLSVLTVERCLGDLKNVGWVKEDGGFVTGERVDGVWRYFYEGEPARRRAIREAKKHPVMSPAVEAGIVAEIVKNVVSANPELKQRLIYHYSGVFQERYGFPPAIEAKTRFVFAGRILKLCRTYQAAEEYVTSVVNQWEDRAMPGSPTLSAISSRKVFEKLSKPADYRRPEDYTDEDF